MFTELSTATFFCEWTMQGISSLYATRILMSWALLADANTDRDKGMTIA
jgi:hypothetical protein